MFISFILSCLRKTLLHFVHHRSEEALQMYQSSFHGLRPEKLLSGFLINTQLLRVPRQSASDKGDNGMTARAVHRSPVIYLTSEESFSTSHRLKWGSISIEMSSTNGYWLVTRNLLWRLNQTRKKETNKQKS